MALISKPDYTHIWASGGSVVEPSNTKKQTGWTAEVPPFQWENWIQNRQDQFIAHVNQRGIPQWDGQTEYEAGGLSYVQGSNGVVYKSVAASGPATTVQDPTTDVSDTYWEIAFASAALATETEAGIGELATQAEAEAGVNDQNFMTPLKTKQAIAVLAGSTLDTVRIDVASASTVNLTSVAPSTRHINITGSTTIDGFTVAAGRCYFVRFNASLTLTNSASLVTNSSANITTAAGDSCIIRATAANTVEILMFVRGVIGQSKAVSGYRVFHDGTATPLICQWGTASTVSSTNVTANFPIPFPNNFFQATTAHGTTGTPSATGYGVTTNSTINLRISVTGNSEIKYIAWGN